MTGPRSLFEHAQRLHALTPDGPLPDGGRPLPDDPAAPARSPDRPTALAALLRDVAEHPVPVADLHRRCTELPVRRGDERRIAELAPAPSAALLTAARWLVRHGTDRRPVLIGLGLLTGHAELADVPLLRLIGRLAVAEDAALRALVAVPGAEPDVIWPAERSRPHARVQAVTALAGRADPAVRDWVRATPPDLLDSELARTIAEAHGLAALLRRDDVGDRLWDQAGVLLRTMTSTNWYRARIGAYRDAPAAYRRWVAAAEHRTPSLDRAAALAAVAEDIRTGPAAPVLGPERGALLARIRATVTSPPWARVLDAADPHRAAWVRAGVREDVPAGRFAVRIVLPDPEPIGQPGPEARVLIDGMPVVARYFDRGPADDPDELVHSGALRATAEPREVRLAEAYCTEGCHGALRVTIRRAGAHVIWERWRAPDAEAPDVRFDAAAYDRELDRVEPDRGWEWPARTVARLVAERWRADPSILGRWDCRPGWCTSGASDRGRAVLRFHHPARTASAADPRVEFGLAVPVDDRDPHAIAAAVVESLRAADPKPTATLIGGTPGAAQLLGLGPRRPTPF